MSANEFSGTEQAEQAGRWFIRLFAIAIVAHLAGNPTGFTLGPGTVAAAAAGVLAVLLIVQPDWRLTAPVGALVLATGWFEAPVLGNHWLVMAFLALIVIGAALAAARHGQRTQATRWWEVVAPHGRLLFLIFYSFSAFAKLNRGFFHSAESCGLFYANQTLDSWRLPALGASWLIWLLIVSVVAVELSVPLLLLGSSTRRHGVLLACVFHFAVSLDLNQHFYDFSAVVFLLVMLFLPDHQLAHLERQITRWPAASVAVAAGSFVLVLASVAPASSVTNGLLLKAAFLWWVPIGLLVVRSAVAQHQSGSVGLRPAGLGWLVVALVVANGLAPYLEVKTANGFNMYSNLRTVGGETNHFLVPVTAHLSRQQFDAVEILASDDPGLSRYVDSGYALTRTRLADYLSYQHPATTVTFSGTATGKEETATAAELAQRLPILEDKFRLFRAIDQREPERCQANWLPAY